MPNVFEVDVTRIRTEARANIEQGAVTAENTGDTGRIIEVLNQVVATEMVCYLRYTQNAIEALANVEAVGNETEISTEMFFGGSRAPALKIRDFKFSSTTTH